jgi:hypothetical protein
MLDNSWRVFEGHVLHPKMFIRFLPSSDLGALLVPSEGGKSFLFISIRDMMAFSGTILDLSVLKPVEGGFRRCYSTQID